MLSWQRKFFGRRCAWRVSCPRRAQVAALDEAPQVPVLCCPCWGARNALAWAGTAGVTERTLLAAARGRWSDVRLPRAARERVTDPAAAGLAGGLVRPARAGERRGAAPARHLGCADLRER